MSHGRLRLLDKVCMLVNNLSGLLTFRTAKSSLPVVHHALRNDQIAAANKADRMTIWIKNVERMPLIFLSLLHLLK